MAAPTAAELRREFLLDPEVAFLNHGSFGACPRPVFERYQAWSQRELEREPIDFFARRLAGSPRGGTRRARRLPRLRRRTTSPSSRTRRPASTSRPARSTSARATRSSRPTSSTAPATSPGNGSAARTGARYVRAAIPLPLDDPRTRRRALRRRDASGRASSTSPTSRRKPALVLPLEEIVAPRPRARPRHDRRRRARAGAGAARPRRARRRLLRRELPQVALRTEGRRLPPRPTRAPGARRRGDRQLGVRRGPRRSSRGSRGRARATRPRSSPCPTRSRSRRSATGTTSASGVAALTRDARAGALRPPRHRAARAGGDGAPDGERAAPRTPPPTSRERLFATTTASRSRSMRAAATTSCGSRSPPTRRARTSSGCSPPSLAGARRRARSAGRGAPRPSDPEREHEPRAPRLPQRADRDLAPEDQEPDERGAADHDHGREIDRLLERPAQQPGGQRDERRGRRRARPG